MADPLQLQAVLYHFDNLSKEAKRHFVYRLLLNQQKDSQKEIENKLYFNNLFFQKLQKMQQQRGFQILFLKRLHKRNYKAYLQWKKRLKRKRALSCNMDKEDLRNTHTNKNTNTNLKPKALHNSEMLWQRNLYMRRSQEGLKSLKSVQEPHIHFHGHGYGYGYGYGYFNCSRKAFKVSP